MAQVVASAVGPTTVRVYVDLVRGLIGAMRRESLKWHATRYGPEVLENLPGTTSAMPAEAHIRALGIEASLAIVGLGGNVGALGLPR